MVSRRALVQGGLFAGLASPAFAFAKPDEDGVYAIPVRMTSERLWTYLEPRKGEQFVAVFDTGAASNVIAEETATRLKLDWKTSAAIEGLGGREEGRWVVMEKPRVGGTFEPDQWWFLTSKTLDNQFFRMLIGGHTLVYYNSELDLNQAQWRVYGKGPMRFDGYTRIENSYKINEGRDGYRGTEMQLDARVGDFAGTFHFDTGSPTNFVLDGSATAKLGIWNAQQPYAPWRIGGFGPNRVKSRLYRLKSATIHGLALDAPLVMLTDPAKAASRIVGFDGLIGMKAIRHFNVLFDARSRALWLKPNHLDFEDKDGRYPMSGLWLEKTNGAIVVDEVGIGSPAAEAGILAGDAIVAADFKTLLASINGDEGDVVSVQIERKGRRLESQFTLRPYL